MYKITVVVLLQKWPYSVFHMYDGSTEIDFPELGLECELIMQEQFQLSDPIEFGCLIFFVACA